MRTPLQETPLHRDAVIIALYKTHLLYCRSWAGRLREQLADGKGRAELMALQAEREAQAALQQEFTNFLWTEHVRSESARALAVTIQGLAGTYTKNDGPFSAPGTA